MACCSWRVAWSITPWRGVCARGGAYSMKCMRDFVGSDEWDVDVMECMRAISLGRCDGVYARWQLTAATTNSGGDGGAGDHRDQWLAMAIVRGSAVCPLPRLLPCSPAVCRLAAQEFHPRTIASHSEAACIGPMCRAPLHPRGPRSLTPSRRDSDVRTRLRQGPRAAVQMLIDRCKSVVK